MSTGLILDGYKGVITKNFYAGCKLFCVDQIFNISADHRSNRRKNYQHKKIGWVRQNIVLNKIIIFSDLLLY